MGLRPQFLGTLAKGCIVQPTGPIIERMLDKPSENEEEYFARQEIELRRKMAAERQEKIAAEERESARALHLMKCPKCGMQLEDISLGDVRVDKCFNCQGLWLDAGELEKIPAKEPGFMGRVLNVFHS